MIHFPNQCEPVILSIAAFDPMGGAGVVADLKTFAAHACYGVAAITAIAVEGSRGVEEVHPVEASVLQSCISSVLASASVNGIKIGMLATQANAEAVLSLLESNPSLPVVLDPLVCSAKGEGLINAAGLEFVRTRLLRQATVITPNLLEAAVLTGLKVENLDEMKAAAEKLIEIGARAVVVTGGHLERPVDVFADGSSVQCLAGNPIKPEKIYGAACAFSSALAANLAQGRQLDEAVVLAKAYVTEAIKTSRAVGPGRRPLNHLYRMQEAHRSVDLPSAGVASR
jgi:hydroxymethylpyrimidine/phosphomethylpyrimidine kinase